MVPFGTQEWLDALAERIAGSPAYAEAAATWEGAVAFVFEADEPAGWLQTRCAVLDLWHGECRSARLVDHLSAASAPFRIRAPYRRWKQVLTGELDPIRGMMQGKLQLSGDLATIVRHVKASKELVDLAAQVPTAFPDEGS
jgi:putative sterol carrier protein